MSTYYALTDKNIALSAIKEWAKENNLFEKENEKTGDICLKYGENFLWCYPGTPVGFARYGMTDVSEILSLLSKKFGPIVSEYDDGYMVLMGLEEE